MIEKVFEIVRKNMDMIFNGSEYTSVINQRLGKKRIRMLNKIIEIMVDRMSEPIRQLDINMQETMMEELINNVHEGDCLEVMKRIPDESIDMVLCDLPYGTTQNKWDSVVPLDKLWKQYNRIVKKNGAIVLTSYGIFTAQLMLSQPEQFKYKWIWEKSKATNFLNSKKQPLRKYEEVCVFYRNQPIYNPQMREGDPYDKGYRKNQLTGSYGDFSPVLVKSDGCRYPVDVIYFKTAESEGEVYHPTQKPVELGRYMVKTYSNPGDIILDNTSGSGSFLVSATLEGRNFIGIELNQHTKQFKDKNMDFIEVSKQRILEAYKSLKNNKKASITKLNLFLESEE